MIPERAAEVIVDLPGDTAGRRGSGYLVATDRVLTAAHVVAGAAKIRVRFEADRPGEWTATIAEVRSALPGADVAVLTVDGAPTEPVRYGRIGHRDAVLQCSSLGFPRFKLRQDTGGVYRDTAHVVGSVAVLANARSGALELTVPAPPSAEPGHSPWEGMSGAPVFAGEHLIGLVHQHHPKEGTGRLTALRVDGFPPDLRAFLDIPDALPDVLPHDLGALTEATYVAQVKDIAPERLVQREDHLARLVEFCAGPEPYLWLRGRPWAGKTALTSWFVLHPPAGVRAASFFVTSRMSGYADAEAFLQAMIEQLAVIAGRTEAVAGTQVARRGLFLDLLDAAALRCRERGERLLLVVDGLDEDQGRNPSIAYLLPKRPPDGVRVLVSSRPHPGVPSDVSGGHPLHHCPRWQLDPTPYARHTEAEARHELGELLRRPEMAGVLGLIAACGGGLTLSDLIELTGMPRFKLSGRLGSAFGRSLRLQSREASDRVYLFAHETLRAEAEAALGEAALRAHRERLHRWAEGYRDRGWPEDTPNYLLQPYGRQLIFLADLPRLCALATDRARQDLLLRRTGSHYVSLTELNTALNLLVRQSRPDLLTAALLAEDRSRISERGTVPPDLPALYARLGQVARAQTLATVNGGSTTYARLAVTLAESAPERAGHALSAALSAVPAATSANRGRRAHRLIDLIVPCSLLRPGEVPHLVRECESLIDPDDGNARYKLVEALVESGNVAAAEPIARGIDAPDTFWRIRALTAVAMGLEDVDLTRARRLLDEADRLARSPAEGGDSPDAYDLIAKAATRLDPDRLPSLVRRASDALESREIGRPAAIRTLIGAGRLDEAQRAFAELTGFVRAVTGEELLGGLLRAGRMEEAGTLIDEEPNPVIKNHWLFEFVERLAVSGHSEEAVRRAADGYFGAAALTTVAGALVTAAPAEALRLADQALRAAHSTPHVQHRDETLAALAESLATDDPSRAAQAVAAMDTKDSWSESVAARTFAAAGDLERTLAVLDRCDQRDAVAENAMSAALLGGRITDATTLAGASSDDLAGAVRRLGEALVSRRRPRPATKAVQAALFVCARYEGLERLRIRAAVLAALADAGLLRRPLRLLKPFPPEEPAADPVLDFRWVDPGHERPWWAIVPDLGALARAVAARDPASARRLVEIGRSRIPAESNRHRTESLAMLALGLAPIAPEGAQALAWKSRSALEGDFPGHTSVGALPDVIHDTAHVFCAVALARTGLPGEAEAVARVVIDPEERARALAYLAELLADQDRNQAERITADLLGGEHWRAAFSALRVLRPDALRAVLDAVLTQSRS
ncbi:S1 family peptidase [Actinoallomurus soli]|uniref:S1 family peptidase n=1 Tax=Actinoallomurus soli TaxID=2952535 RepID=UPI002091E61E|nr:serine protease [Actinoallomurus soli]MCO5968212.1 serine protease [Actinoallomurus soli]